MGISTTKKEEEEKNKNKNTTSREFKIVWTNFVSKYRAHNFRVHGTGIETRTQHAASVKYNKCVTETSESRGRRLIDKHWRIAGVMAEVAFVDTKTFTSTTLPTKALHLPLHLLAASLSSLSCDTKPISYSVKYIYIYQWINNLLRLLNWPTIWKSYTLAKITQKERKRRYIFPNRKKIYKKEREKNSEKLRRNFETFQIRIRREIGGKFKVIERSDGRVRKDVYLHEEGGGGFTDNLMQIVKVVPLAGTNVALRGITKEGGDVERV